ncbi:MAG: carbon storage regulator [Ktedonobacteraceae bacterium]|nr:carbon storage regulator [Ktedonobacteraceae bacterium]
MKIGIKAPANVSIIREELLPGRKDRQEEQNASL